MDSWIERLTTREPSCRHAVTELLHWILSGNGASEADFGVYETLIIHRGAMAWVGQNSLHLKQATHKWGRSGSALWFTIWKTPIEQRSMQVPHPLQKMRSTYTSIRIVGEGPTSKTIRLAQVSPAGDI